MQIPLSLQFINLLAALLLLIVFAMLAQRRILSLVNLFAWQGSGPGAQYLSSWPTPRRSIICMLLRGADFAAEGVCCCPGCCTV